MCPGSHSWQSWDAQRMPTVCSALKPQGFRWPRAEHLNSEARLPELFGSSPASSWLCDLCHYLTSVCSFVTGGRQ